MRALSICCCLWALLLAGCGTAPLYAPLPRPSSPFVVSVTPQQQTALAQVRLAAPVLAATTSTASVRLAWNPSPTSQLAGYRLYQGWAYRTYTNAFDVGRSVTNTIVNGLTPGARYTFSVTAFTSAGLESAFCNEVSYAPPTTTGGGKKPPKKQATNAAQ